MGLRNPIAAVLVLIVWSVSAWAFPEKSRPLFVIWDEHGKFGFIDESGRVAIAPRFDCAYPFTEGLAGVCIDKKWGFIDKTGAVVVPLAYRAVSPFADGLAAVYLPVVGCGYIDRSGKVVIAPQTKFSCSPFAGGLAVVDVYDAGIGETVSAYLDPRGTLAIADRFAYAAPFSEGLARVDDFSRSYFINQFGGTVIQFPSFADERGDIIDPVGSFSEGLAEVGIKSVSVSGYARYGFIDRSGNPIVMLPPEMVVRGAFHSGRALVFVRRSEKERVRLGRRETIVMNVDASGYGYVDRTGKLVIPPRFAEALDFFDGLAVVRRGPRRRAGASAMATQTGKAGGSYECIDTTGAVVVRRCGEPVSAEDRTRNFGEFGPGFGVGFVDGLYFSVTTVPTEPGGRRVFGYMNRKGRYVWLQPHGRNVVPPRWWWENLGPFNP